MVPTFNEALTQAVRRLAQSTTPDDLKRRGVSRVRSVSLQRISELIEKAVNRTVLARTIGGFPSDARSIAGEAREEFLRLLGGPAEPSGEGQGSGAAQATGAAQAADPARPVDLAPGVDAPRHDGGEDCDDGKDVEDGKDGKDGEDDRGDAWRQTSSTLDRLHHELRERRADVECQRQALAAGDGTAGDGDRNLEQRLHELFAAGSGGSPSPDRGRPADLEQEVIRLAVGELRRERARAEGLRLEEHQREIELLERRIAKLARLLGETEQVLAEAARRDEDPGLASQFSAIQGLSPEDALFQRKAELLDAIYQANLELQAYRAGSREPRADVDSPAA